MDVPANYKEVLQDPEIKNWKKAMKSEIDSIERNKIWTLVELSFNRKTIGCKWIYKLKFVENGIIECYKARLVAKGYIQQERIDFNETFASVAKFLNIQIILRI